MLTLTRDLRYYFSIDRVSFRNRVNGMSAHVRDVLGCDPRDKDAVYVFLNTSRRELRLLHYEGNGYVLYCKRLDPGVRFRRPVADARTGRIEMTWLDFGVLMEGVVRCDLLLAGPPPASK